MRPDRLTADNSVYMYQAGKGQYLAEMVHFLACLQGLAMPGVDIQEGIEVLRLALAAHSSAEIGQVIHME